MPKEKNYDFTFEGGDLDDLASDLEPNLTEDGLWQPPSRDEAKNDDDEPVTKIKKKVDDDDLGEIVVEDEAPPPQGKHGKESDEDPNALPELPDPDDEEGDGGLDPRMADMQARLEAMEAEKRQQAREGVEAQIKSREADLNARLTAAQDRLTAALEAGESKQAAAAQVEIGRITAEEMQFKAQVEGYRQQIKVDEERIRTAPAPQKINPHLQGWLKKNPWFNSQDAKWKAHQKIAREIDKAMVDEGFNPEHPKYFERLDERVREEVKKRATAAQRSAPVDRVQGVGVGSSSAASLQQGKPGRIVITRDEIAMMQKLKMDVKDPKVLKAFAATKRERMQEEAKTKGAR